MLTVFREVSKGDSSKASNIGALEGKDLGSGTTTAHEGISNVVGGREGVIECVYSGSGSGMKLVRGGELFLGSGCSTVSEGGSLNCNSDVGGGHKDENEEGSQGSGIC